MKELTPKGILFKVLLTVVSIMFVQLSSACRWHCFVCAQEMWANRKDIQDCCLHPQLSSEKWTFCDQHYPTFQFDMPKQPSLRFSKFISPYNSRHKDTF